MGFDPTCQMCHRYYSRHMSRVQKLVQQLTQEIQAEASRQDNPNRLLDKDVAALAQMPASTLSGWITGNNKTPQIEAFLRLLELLPPERRNPIVNAVLNSKSLKFFGKGKPKRRTRNRRIIISLKSKPTLN